MPLDLSQTPYTGYWPAVQDAVNLNTTALAAKADASTVSGKADQSAVTTALALKADLAILSLPVLPPIGQYVPPEGINATSTVAPTSGKTGFCPIRLRAATYDAILFYLSTAQSNDGTVVVKTALYPDDGTGGNPVTSSGPLGSGTAVLTGTAAANVISVLGTAVTVTTATYWLAFFYYASVAPTTAATIPMVSTPSFIVPAPTSVGLTTRVRGRTRTGTTDLPADATASSVSGSNDVALMAIRRSA